MRSHRLYGILLFLIVYGCVAPLEIRDDIRQRLIVVDGLVTNEDVPYVVTLYHTTTDVNANLKDPITGANVSIEDDAGVIVTLTETIPGRYETDPAELKGAEGRSYKLKVTTPEGQVLESTWEKMYRNGEVNSIDLRHLPGVLIPEEPDPTYDPLTSEKDAFDIHIDATGTSGEPNLFMWRWKGTYHIHTYPEEVVRPTSQTPGSDDPVIFIPNPLSCSGFIEEDSTLVRVGDCFCCDCWITETDAVVHLSSPEFTSNARAVGVKITRLPINGIRWYEKYHIEISQITLSPNTYRFWNLVRAQQRAPGDIFQPNGVRVTGNITCVNDPDIEVLGIFGASSIVRKGLYILPSDIPVNVPLQERIAADCRARFTQSTTTKPDWW